MDHLNEFLYYRNKNKRCISYNDILSQVQQYIAKEHSEALVSANHKADTVSLLKRYIQDYVAVQGFSTDECTSVSLLVDRLYKDMAEYSFLTDILKLPGLEEVNINSWNDIEIIIKGGYRKLEERFASPSHAVDVIRRMLAISNMVLDDTTPISLGHLSKNVRIATLKNPVVDDDAGISASIRIINPDRLKTEDLLKGDVATDEMLQFLQICIRFGVSLCFAGATGSGKTTVAGWLLSTIPDNKRVFTIEDGSRELDLVRYDENGKVKNRIVSTKTRTSDNPKYSITQDDLLDVSLRFDPDIICVGEMRGTEAFSAQEAARTGHTVISTIHSNSCESTYRRMMTLAKRKFEMGDDTLMGLMIEAFPVIAYCHQLEDRARKITEIIEAEGYRDGKLIYRSLFRYVVDDNNENDGVISVKGHFERVRGISNSLYASILRNGAPKTLIDKFKIDNEVVN